MKISLTPMALARREAQLARAFRALRKMEIRPASSQLQFDYAMVPVAEDYVLSHMPIASEWN